MQGTLLQWVLFNLFVVLMLVIDLGVFNRRAHTVKVKEALLLSALWIGLALIFNAGIYYWVGKPAALEFLTGYIIEKSLSVDNLFVFLLIFSYFKVPSAYQHRILFWGILGAIVMRAIFIFTGVALIHKFSWIVYVFGAFLIFTGIKLVVQKEKEIRPENNIVLKLFKKIMPINGSIDEGRFFKKMDGRIFATPMFVVLLVIETSDLIFAVDSIPAILAITKDTFIVYTSNVFAILGLRALYFALAGVMDMFHYLNYGLALILSFVGVKMIVANFYKIPTGIALGTVAGILMLSILVSMIWPKAER